MENIADILFIIKDQSIISNSLEFKAFLDHL